MVVTGIDVSKAMLDVAMAGMSRALLRKQRSGPPRLAAVHGPCGAHPSRVLARYGSVFPASDSCPSESEEEFEALQATVGGIDIVLLQVLDRQEFQRLVPDYPSLAAVPTPADARHPAAALGQAGTVSDPDSICRALCTGWLVFRPGNSHA